MPELAVSTDELVRYMDDVQSDGSNDRSLPACVSPELAVELLRRMILMRTYDERSLVYHRHGRIGTYAIYWGHEAMQVGAVSAMGDDDWILPSYRESAVGLMRDIDPATILAWWRGHPSGWWDPREHRITSISVPVGSHIPHAVGVAWGERLQGRNAAALAFFGDGATSEGDVHEGANFAAVLDLPVVLLCNNNGWAITTPISKQTKARTLADKAVGYGMASARVDGNDVLAVFEAVQEAVERGKRGDGPTFIECVSYRPHLHATADDTTTYRDDEEAARARENECVARYERYLLRAGLVTADQVEQMRADALALMADAIARAEALEPGTIDDLFDTTYASMPPAFARDRAEVEELLLGEGR